MKLLIVVLTSLMFIGSANAEGLFTKVDSYTLEGLGTVRASNNATFNFYTANVPGFHTLADCEAAIQTIKERTYTGAYATFAGNCHKVKVVVPVLN